jgi:hypothetical protein
VSSISGLQGQKKYMATCKGDLVDMLNSIEMEHFSVDSSAASAAQILSWNMTKKTKLHGLSPRANYT